MLPQGKWFCTERMQGYAHCNTGHDNVIGGMVSDVDRLVAIMRWVPCTYTCIRQLSILFASDVKGHMGSEKA